MLIRDLIEAVLQPGDKKAIALQLDTYRENLYKVKKYKEQLGKITFQEHPPGMEQKINDLIKDYEEAIAKFEAELAANDKEGRKLNNLVKGIEKNCSEALSVYRQTGLMLYRGVNSYETAFYGKPFDERRVKDSNEYYSDLFNSMLRKAGVVARRDNSIFCSGRKSQAEGYGRSVYMIFPRNGFSFSWSRNTGDLVIDSEQAFKMFSKDRILELFSALADNPEYSKAFMEQFNKVSPYGDFRGFEKSLIGQYHGFISAYEWKIHLEVIQELVRNGTLPEEFSKLATIENLVTPEATIKNFQIDTTDFKEAAESGKEVMIRGEYYAINFANDKQVRNLLDIPGGYY